MSRPRKAITTSFVSFDALCAFILILASTALPVVNANADGKVNTTRKTAASSLCTLCPGTNEIPYPDTYATAQQTCQDLAMIAIFYDENELFCTYFRDVAKTPCACSSLTSESPTSTPTLTPTHAPSVAPTISPSNISSNVPSITSTKSKCSLCPDGTPLSNDYKDKTITSNSMHTCSDLEKDALDYDESTETCEQLFRPFGVKYCGCQTPTPTLAPSTLPTIKESVSPSSHPTSIFDIAPDCNALMNGEYPQIPETSSGINYELFDYTAELFLDLDNHSESLSDNMITMFEESASRVVSAGSAGCYSSETNTYSRLRRNLNNELSDDGGASTTIEERTGSKLKVYYVEFSKADDYPQESCDTEVLFTSSSCHVIKGKISILYSLKGESSSTKNNDKTWIEVMINRIIHDKSDDIVVNVDGVNYARLTSMQLLSDNSVSALEGVDENNQRDNGGIGIPIGLGVGIFALLIIAGLFIKRSRSVYHAQHNGRKNRNEENISISKHDALDGRQQLSSLSKNGYDVYSFPYAFEDQEDHCDFDHEHGSDIPMEDVTNTPPLDEGIEIELLERYLSMQPKKSTRSLIFNKQKQGNTNVQYDNTVDI